MKKQENYEEDEENHNEEQEDHTRKIKKTKTNKNIKKMKEFRWKMALCTEDEEDFDEAIQNSLGQKIWFQNF